MDIIDYFRIALKSWRLVVAAIIVGMISASASFAIQPVVYTSASRTLVSLENPNTPQELGRTAEELAMGRSYITGETAVYAQAVTATEVVDKAIDALDGEVTPQQLRLHIYTEVLGGNTIQIKVTANSAAVALERAEALTAAFIDVFGDSNARIQLTLLEEPSLPSGPTTPGFATYLALGGFVGAAIGIGIAVLRHILRGRVTSLKDVESTSPIPVVAGIGTFDKHALSTGNTESVMEIASSEGIQALRAVTLGADDTPGVRYHITTSPLTGAGATTVAMALAAAISLSGRRVLLVTSAPPPDTKTTPVPSSPEPGTAELGSGDLWIRAIEVNELGDEVLTVAHETWDTPRGRLRVATDDYWDRLAAYCTRNAIDDVVFDAPPVLTSSVALDLCRPNCVLLLVVAADETRLPDLRAATAAIEGCESALTAVVLNKIPVRPREARQFGRFGYYAARRNAS